MGAETAAPERVMTCNWGWRRRSAINIGGGCADFEEGKRRRSEMWKQPTEQNDYIREKKRHIIERIQGQLMERDMDRLKGWRGEREKINWKRKRKEKKEKESERRLRGYSDLYYLRNSHFWRDRVFRWRPPVVAAKDMRYISVAVLTSAEVVAGRSSVPPRRLQRPEMAVAILLSHTRKHTFHYIGQSHMFVWLNKLPRSKIKTPEDSIPLFFCLSLTAFSEKWGAI